MGEDILVGNSGADVFVLSHLDAVDIIEDFNINENDKIDLSNILEGYDPLTESITDFVRITNSGGNSIVSVDVDGSTNDFVQIAIIEGVGSLTNEQNLENNGILIT